MHLNRFLAIPLLLVILISNIFSQTSFSTSLLVQLEKGLNPKNITDGIIRNNKIYGKIKIKKLCESPANIWKFTFDDRNEEMDKVISYLSLVDGVEKAQINHRVFLRNIPNDKKFSSQWSLNNTGQTGGAINADIDADLAWDRTTGGVTKNGDTIVICIIDTGVDSDHEDLKDNLWINRNEIEDNGIDDDNNGYVDDYRGWNPVLGTDDIDGASHGVSVAGIIGAKGNNEIGIAGINWSVKLLIIPMSGQESDIIEAYSYVYTMRKLYNETNGEKGAFIVATNNSFGLDNRKAEDFPIWCSMYDLMGEVGVISIGATTNAKTNVDIYGDMPSTCPSDFLITVTNMDYDNVKYNSSGYGKLSVDLGAFGEKTFSTKPNNNYGSFGGTSAATPHVTGVLGLLYSDNKKIADNCKTYPVQTSLMVKDAILNGVIHNETLEDITTTEGVLNANESLKGLDKYDEDCSPPVQLVIENIEGKSFEVSWNDYKPESNYNIRYRKEGENWDTILNIASPYKLDELESCTDYYFAIQTACDNSQFGFVSHVKTDGCCNAPKVITFDITNNKLHLEWNKLLAAKEYSVKYKFWSYPIWNEVKTNENYIDLDIDLECGQYAVSLQSICQDSTSVESENLLYGNVCLDCKKNVYCLEKIDNNDEWIESFAIDKFSNKSGPDIDGKGDFTDSKSIKLIEGNEYSAKVEVKYRSVKYDDYIYLWIDMNSDSIFSPNELIATDSTLKEENIEFNFVMPNIEKVGETTLRVLLTSEKKESPCELYGDDYGEYEDYCVFIDTIAHCITKDINLDTSNVGVDFIQIKWDNPYGVPKFYVRIVDKDNPLEVVNEYFFSDTTVLINKLDTCSDYQIFLTPYCSEIESGNTEIMNVKTHCSTGVYNIAYSGIKIYPNPLQDILHIENLNGSNEIKVEIFDSFGRRVLSKQYNNKSSATIDLQNLIIPGLYIVKIKQGKEYFIHKIIKI